MFFQSLPSYSIDRINKQIRWGIKVCFFRTKYDTAHKRLLENKILPAELHITKTSLNRLRYCPTNKHLRPKEFQNNWRR